jgi:hypothetical protein
MRRRIRLVAFIAVLIAAAGAAGYNLWDYYSPKPPTGAIFIGSSAFLPGTYAQSPSVMRRMYTFIREKSPFKSEFLVLRASDIEGKKVWKARTFKQFSIPRSPHTIRA